MYDNYNYPPGADNPSAPWNEKEPPVREFDVVVSQSLSKQLKIDAPYVYTKEMDDMGGFEEIDTSNVNWIEEYSNNGCLTPLELIGEFKKILSNLLNTDITGRTRMQYKSLLKECDGWVEDECIVEEA